MQILIAVLVMGVIGVVATVLVAAAALVRLAPLLIVALVVAVVVRTIQRRGLRRLTASPPGAGPPPLPRLAPRTWPMPPRSDGWVLVPMWWLPERHLHRPIIDADVISVEEHDG